MNVIKFLRCELAFSSYKFFSLVNRKEQWKKDEEDRIANTPDPAMPPGHRVLPENERKQTLNLLQESEYLLAILVTKYNNV